MNKKNYIVLALALFWCILSISSAQDEYWEYKVMQMEVTAYCPCAKCCGKYADGFTCTGKDAFTKGVAVDPRLIPLGSYLYIEGYCCEGERVEADDVGGAIKRNHIDIRFKSHAEALQWGRKYINVGVWIKK